MKRARRTLWCTLAIGLLTWPLLSLSCVEIARRATINGFFDAVTPLVDEQFGECLTAFNLSRLEQ